MQTPCLLSSGDRAGARTWASHFSQAGCLEEVGLPPTWSQTADQAGGGTLVLSPGSTFYEGACSAWVGTKPCQNPRPLHLPNLLMPHPAGTSGPSLRVGSESSNEETEAPRGAAQKWQSGRLSDLGDSAQVWVPLNLQAVIPLPVSDLPHPRVLPSSPSQHHLAQPQVSSPPFAYENRCAPPSPLHGSWCLPRQLPLRRICPTPVLDLPSGAVCSPCTCWLE